ncbi:hypothetical protein KAH37_00335 [bacterium]|nr:hypothetical protein [bacterium]
MRSIYLAVFTLSLIFSGCSFPSQDDKENITALTDIYAHAFDTSDKKSLYYVLDEDFPQKAERVKQIEYRGVYLKDISFHKKDFVFTDSSFLNKTVTGVMTYNVSYRKKEEQLPTMQQGKKRIIVFQKGRQSWKILSMTNIKESGKSVDKQLFFALYQSLDTRIEAMNNKDMELFATVLSSTLSTKAEVVEDLQKSIDTFKDIVYILKERHPIEITNKRAIVVQKYEMRLTLPDGTQQKVPVMAEKLVLEPNKSGKWQIVDGLGGS